MEKGNRNRKVVTRFAPSPTGFLHVGGVRTALYAWLFARQHGGTFILRIEDTDKAREVAGSMEHIIQSLKWLGIEWDEGPDIGGPCAPYIQSERLDIYKKYAQELVDKGLAYADPYSEEQLEALREQAKAEKKPFLYRDHRPENPPVWDGTQPLRFKITDLNTYEWDDLVRGKLSAGPEALDDFIIIKSDGYPTYNLSHMIDDLEMGVTHIMRSDEFLASTPKFLALYEGLDIKRPEIGLLPPIMSPDGKKKLGKRDGAKDILDYKNEGYLPEAMMNFLAFIGWNPGGEKELYSKEELIEAFDISKVHKSGGGFNVEKLNWFNREYIKKLSSADFWQYANRFIPDWISTEKIDKADIETLLRDRINKFDEVAVFFEESRYMFEKPEYGPEKLLWKGSSIENTKKHLIKVIELCNNIDSWNKDSVHSIVFPYADEAGRGDVLWPMRVALSGKDKSPDPFILAGILGKEETIDRLEEVQNKL